MSGPPNPIVAVTWHGEYVPILTEADYFTAYDHFTARGMKHPNELTIHRAYADDDPMDGAWGLVPWEAV